MGIVAEGRKSKGDIACWRRAAHWLMCSCVMARGSFTHVCPDPYCTDRSPEHLWSCHQSQVARGDAPVR